MSKSKQGHCIHRASESQMLKTQINVKIPRGNCYKGLIPGGSGWGSRLFLVDPREGVMSCGHLQRGTTFFFLTLL